MASPSLISVIVPVMNEEENVPLFYDAVRAVTDSLNELEWEFIFVEDGSTDRTLERLLALRVKDPRVKILQFSRNFGSYPALRAGLDYSQGDACITISADLQDSPELFRSFLAQWQEGSDIVWGVRAQRDDPWAKKTLASLFYRLLRILALSNLPTDGMDCALFDRKVVNAFLQISDIHNITFMTIYWMGFRQTRVPYHRKGRQFGKSKWPLGRRIKSALDVITSFSGLPLRFASYLGMTVSTLSLLGALIIFFNKLVLGIGSWGWPSMMMSILFLGGIQLVMLGVMGEYLWRIGNQVRGQPQYIVMKEIGFDRRPERMAIPSRRGEAS